MKSIYIYLIGLILLSSCATAKIVDNSEIKQIVSLQTFNLESDAAQPLFTVGMSQIENSGLLGPGNSAGNISLVGNSNFLKIMRDSITSYLPYYGEQRSSVSYGTDNGAIELEGEILNYNSVWDDKKQHYTIRFQAKSNNELFDVRIILYPNLKSYITLSSSARTSITYIGKVSGIKDDEV